MDINSTLISELKFDPNNARLHNKKNLDAIGASYKQFGQRKPIVIKSDGTVISGNGQLEAAQSLGWTHIDTVEIPDDWNESKILAFALADNKTAELATWDHDILAKALADISDIGWDIQEMGFADLNVEVEDADTSMQDLGERYEIVIECANENDQTGLLLRLSGEGLRVKAIII